MEKIIKKPTFVYSLSILLMVIAIITVGLLFFDASVQIMLFISLMLVIPFVMRLGYSYQDVEKQIFTSMLRALQPALILIAVGTLIGAWIASGTVPALIYYGIQSISPQFFLVTTLIFCSLVSLATGSSWATLGTAGVAMMGVGYSLGVPVGLTGGAIVSGAYFGEKISPLSDTTNLAPAVVGTDIFTHIKHMLWTTVPAYTITAIIFTIIGLNSGGGSVNSAEVNTLTSYLTATFNLGFVPFIPAIVLFTLLIMKKPAITSIFVGAMVGAVVAIVYQGFAIADVFAVLYSGYAAESGIAIVDTLLIRGGLLSMLPMMLIFLIALGLGGLLEKSGILETIIRSFASKIKSTGMLTFITSISSYLTLGLGGTFSFAGVMTGTVMKPVYQRFNLRPENLSRTMEDSATQSAPLLPWTASGVFTATALGIPATAYIPFSFLAMFTLFFTLLYGFTGFTMKKEERIEESEEELPA